MDANSLTWLTK